MSLPDLTSEQLCRLDINAPRYTSYPTVPAWSDAFDGEDYARALDRAGNDCAQPLSLYCHIPFCREMCSFCGCNVIVSRSAERADRYLAAMTIEIDRVASHLGGRREVSRLHLGGGTPTMLDVRQLTVLWEALTRRFTMRPDAELAFELDPAVTSAEQLRLLRGFGFNRLSMGVQDFDPAVQQAVNRIQTVDETRALVECARELGYRSVSVDLICGLPRQTPASWATTLDTIVAMSPDRVAVFPFAFVPTMKPHQRRLPLADLPDPSARLALTRQAHERLAAAGYQAIGLDHFARPDDELAVADREGRLWRDFQGYTTLRAPDTIAFGISGIGSVGGAYVQNVRTIAAYHGMLGDGRLPVARGMWLSDDDLRRRALITSIMCNDTVELPAELAGERARLDTCVEAGLCELDGDALHLTALGRMFRRNVAMCFDAHLARGAMPSFSRTV